MKPAIRSVILSACLLSPVYANASIIVSDTSIYASIIAKNYKNETFSEISQGDGDVNIGIMEYGAGVSVRAGRFSWTDFGYSPTIFNSAIMLDSYLGSYEDLSGYNYKASLAAKMFATTDFTVTDSNAMVNFYPAKEVVASSGFSFSLQDLTLEQNVLSYNNEIIWGYSSIMQELIVNHTYELQVSYSTPLTKGIGEGIDSFNMAAMDTDVQFATPYHFSDVQVSVPTPASLGFLCIGLIGIFFNNRRRIF